MIQTEIEIQTYGLHERWCDPHDQAKANILLINGRHRHEEITQMLSKFNELHLLAVF